MTRFRVQALAAAGVILGLCCGAVAQQGTAYVDMNRVFESYYKTVKAEANLKTQEELYKQRAEEMGKSIEEMKKKRDGLAEEAVNVALSVEARAQKKEEAAAADRQYNEKQVELRKFFGDKRNELRQDYMRSRDDLVKELLAQLQAYAKGKGYDTVIDVSGKTQNDLPVVIMYPKDKEFTDAFVQEVNKGHEDELPKKEAPPAPAAGGQ